MINNYCQISVTPPRKHRNSLDTRSIRKTTIYGSQKYKNFFIKMMKFIDVDI